MTTESTTAQPASLPTTSLSRCALAAGFRSALLNANPSSFCSVTVASHRLGAAAAGLATGLATGLAAGFGAGAGAAGRGTAAGAGLGAGLGTRSGSHSATARAGDQ